MKKQFGLVFLLSLSSIMVSGQSPIGPPAPVSFVSRDVVGTAIEAFQTTISNPDALTMTPSADHNTNDITGQPKLTGYRLKITATGATTPIVNLDMGKPTPVANLITYVLPTSIRSAVALGTVYTAVVETYGPGGVAASAPSNPFDYSLTAPAAPGKPALIKQ